MVMYVITHKKFKTIVEDKYYNPMLVGAELGNTGYEFYLRDNLHKDNISYLNQSFCELTGIYDIWKNLNDNVVGITHYRRYFSNSKRIFPKKRILKEKQIKNDLKKYDIILPKKNVGEYNNYTAKDFFAKNHDVDIWNKTKKIIEKTSRSYFDSFEWFEKQKSGYCYNMMICNKEIYDKYCSWLFPILFELYKEIDIDKYDEYNKRMIGFVAERLINVWVHKNNLKIKEYPVYFLK